MKNDNIEAQSLTIVVAGELKPKLPDYQRGEKAFCQILKICNVV